MGKLTSLKYKIIFLFILNNIHRSYSRNCVEIPSPKIVIVGAGASGIAAASKLLENGFDDVTILEAEGRIGGRVNTVKFGEYVVDLGGQWVHGQGENIAYNLANPLGLLEATDSNQREETIDSRGCLLDANLSERIADFSGKYVFTLADDNVPYQSVGKYVEKQFVKYFKSDPKVLRDKNKYLHNFELMRISLDSAISWYDLPARDDGFNYKTYPGNQNVNWKERGYSTILDVLLKRYPNPENELPVLNKTILNTEVVSINYSNNKKKASVLIKTANGHIFKADHVIVTVSLGVLKEKHKSLFIPPLPDYKVAAIKNIGFGSVSKIFLLFDEPFWQIGNLDLMTFTFLWNDADRKEIEADPERKWLLGMYGAMTVEHKPKVLELWTTGKYGMLMETIPEDKVFRHAVENLRRFLGKRYNVTEPVAMIRSQWHSNSHFRGTYSYRTVATQKRKVFSTMLETPLKTRDLRVLFAGEATANDRYSTVDGAIGTGWDAAEKLLNFYGKSTK